MTIHLFHRNSSTKMRQFVLQRKTDDIQTVINQKKPLSLLVRQLYHQHKPWHPLPLCLVFL